MFPIANPKAVLRARQILEYNPIFMDTETTGISNEDVVIEIGVVDLQGTILFESFVNPPIPIPADATAIHGITDSQVAAAPTWKTVWPNLLGVIRNRYVGMYNSDFDLRLLKQTHDRYWMDWSLEDQHFFCVMKLYAAFYGQVSAYGRGYRFHKLEAAGAACGIPLPNSHRAADDALLTAALFRYIAEYEL